MAVPGLISAGSSIHRLVQPGLRRSLATVKLGAVARESCFGSPVMWHFRQGALTLANNCRAMERSASVSGSSFSAMNGCACQERASKKRTSLRISPSEKLGILAFRYWRTPSRFVSLSLSAGLLRKRISHWGLTRAEIHERSRREEEGPIQYHLGFESRHHRYEHFALPETAGLISQSRRRTPARLLQPEVEIPFGAGLDTLLL